MSSCGPNNQADDFYFDVSDFTNKNQQSFPPQISGEGIQIVVDHVDMEQQRKDSCKYFFWLDFSIFCCTMGQKI